MWLKNNPRPDYNYQKDISGCGLAGIIHRQRKLIPGSEIVKSINLMNDRGNGLGSGFAAYGIYPEYKDYYAFHIMYGERADIEGVERFIRENYEVAKIERIPHYHVSSIVFHPRLRRYFVRPKKDRPDREVAELSDDDFVVRTVMKINVEENGAYVFSSGKNMGAFKGVGFPKDIAEFYGINEYEAYIWTGHNRFPTNTPGWWGGAHPFTLLDWSIVHNGEISSYGINKRYLEMFGYRCTLMTDTEVMAYLFDLLIRKHHLSIETACMALAAPFWKDIERLPEEEKMALKSLRMVYGSALVNGPFAILFAHSKGLVGLNDRIKLRPLVAAEKGPLLYMASEESAIREICSNPERVWSPRAGYPVIAWLEEEGTGITAELASISEGASLRL
ncbi:MAG: hypothetical protein A3G93_06020 [Nitrospinae bacterium RIFCSPLOWO2_12_FULL_45_22]|nr:MAG: hypothetical protein A3G93_06020 [Nitrospinae bacterium RIFCSPLOWO2_12_FULL_45_22]